MVGDYTQRRIQTGPPPAMLCERLVASLNTYTRSAESHLAEMISVMDELDST